MNKNQVANVNHNVAAAPKATTVADWLDNSTIRQKFIEVLDKGANGFISSLLSLVKADKQLQSANPKTVMAAAMTAATLKLPINPTLGLAYIIPYKGEATFQIGYKGLIQLAERTGQYRTINASVVYEGQVKGIDFITGEIERGERISDKVVGYVAYIEFINGFKKTLYMSKEEMEHHAKTYSQSYRGGYNSVWKSNFDAMALKTVLKQLISKYGIMSIDMQSADMSMALESDQAIIKKVGEQYDYVDNSDEPIDVLPAETPQDSAGQAETVEHEQVPASDNKTAQTVAQAADDIGLGLE